VIRNEGVLARTARHEHALRAIADGIEAAHPATVVADTVELAGDCLTVLGERYHLDSFEDIFVVGGGKPAGAVAAALDDLLGESLTGGLVVSDAPLDTDRVEVIGGTHPTPSTENIRATEGLLELAEAATEDDLVLAVVGGGGSALLCAPAEGLSVEHLQSLTDTLLDSGATIDEINAVRKHLSRIKGGHLARALAPVTTVGLVFSDVVGNDLSVIASGPVVPDGTTYDDAMRVLDRYDVGAPDAVTRTLERGARGDRPETPGDDDDAFAQVTHHVLADARTALDAAARTCEAAGYTAVVLAAGIEGEAREVGRVQASIARECLATGDPFEPPVAILSGGETTVTVRGDGTGGPNQEFALSGAVALAGTDAVVASVDTDGIDGSTDAAGALVDGSTVENIREAESALDDNDAYGYLDDRDSLIRTGPTGTNVNDLRLVLVGDADSDAS
jgi:glycerate 2-kinase